MDRRTLVSLVPALAFWLQSRTAAAAAPVPGQRLLAVFREPRRAARVGRAYLAAHPVRAGAGELADPIDRALREAGLSPEAATRDELRHALRDLIRADFGAGRTVSVDGWILSASEARLCGLAALAHG